MKKSCKLMMLVLLVCMSVLVFGVEGGDKELGKASYYAKMFEGRKTANGEIFTNSELTAAHKELPLGTKVRVTNLENGRSVVVRINDRGPFIRGRIIDLTERAFDEIADRKLGVVRVSVQVL